MCEKRLSVRHQRTYKMVANCIVARITTSRCVTEKLREALQLAHNRLCNVRRMYTQDNCAHKMAAAGKRLMAYTEYKVKLYFKYLSFSFKLLQQQSHHLSYKKCNPHSLCHNGAGEGTGTFHLILLIT